jgi:hypothetical protein
MGFRWRTLDHAAARGIAINKLESHVEGDPDLRGFIGISEEVRNGYEKIRVAFKIKADASEGQQRVGAVGPAGLPGFRHRIAPRTGIRRGRWPAKPNQRTEGVAR